MLKQPFPSFSSAFPLASPKVCQVALSVLPSAPSFPTGASNFPVMSILNSCQGGIFMDGFKFYRIPDVPWHFSDQMFPSQRFQCYSIWIHFFFWFRRVSFLRTLHGVNTFWWCSVPISLSTPTWGAGEYRYLRVGRHTMKIHPRPSTGQVAKLTKLRRGTYISGVPRWRDYHIFMEKTEKMKFSAKTAKSKIQSTPIKNPISKHEPKIWLRLGRVPGAYPKRHVRSIRGRCPKIAIFFQGCNTGQTAGGYPTL